MVTVVCRVRLLIIRRAAVSPTAKRLSEASLRGSSILEERIVLIKY